MKPSPVDRTFDPFSNGMHNSIWPKCRLEHYSTEATKSGVIEYLILAVELDIHVSNVPEKSSQPHLQRSDLL